MAHQSFKIVGLSVLFIVFISFPLLNTNLNFVQDTKNMENRAMATKPRFNIELLDPFPSAYEPFFNDHFSFRARLIGWYNWINLNVFNKSPFPDKVAIGYNGWMFLVGHEMTAYTGKETLSFEQLESWRKELEFQRDYLEKRGCAFYFMITPSKANIYSEYVPITFYRYHNMSWGEQLLDHLKKYSTIKTISLYEKFRSLKGEKQLYFKLDNHWTRMGAFYASQEASKVIAKDFPDVKPLSISDFDITEVSRKGGDIFNLLGNSEPVYDLEYEFSLKNGLKSKVESNIAYQIREGVHPPQTSRIRTKQKSSLKLYIISDSFSESFFPFIAESFGTSINVFDSWQYDLYGDIIEAEKPTIYIQMRFEPWLKYVSDTRNRIKNE